MMGGQPEISPPSLKAYVVGTIDTKGEELRYVRNLIEEAGIPALLVDVGPRSRTPAAMSAVQRSPPIIRRILRFRATATIENLKADLAGRAIGRLPASFRNTGGTPMIPWARRRAQP